METGQDLILEKLQYFKVEIAKATLPDNLSKQQDNLEKVYGQIVEYLESGVKAADENSMVIGGIIGSLEFIKRTYMGVNFIKDPKKDLKNRMDRIENITWRLNSELAVIGDYVANNTIIVK